MRTNGAISLQKDVAIPRLRVVLRACETLLIIDS
jgi:hypothetical protein